MNFDVPVSKLSQEPLHRALRFGIRRRLAQACFCPVLQFWQIDAAFVCDPLKIGVVRRDLRQKLVKILQPGFRRVLLRVSRSAKQKNDGREGKKCAG